MALCWLHFKEWLLWGKFKGSKFYSNSNVILQHEATLRERQHASPVSRGATRTVARTAAAAAEEPLVITVARGAAGGCRMKCKISTPLTTGLSCIKSAPHSCERLLNPQFGAVREGPWRADVSAATPRAADRPRLPLETDGLPWEQKPLCNRGQGLHVINKQRQWHGIGRIQCPLST